MPTALTVKFGLTARAALVLTLTLLVACRAETSTTPTLPTGAQNPALEPVLEPVLEGEAVRTFAPKRGVNVTGWFQYGEFRESRFSELQKLRDMGADFIRLPLEPTKFYDASSAVWSQLERTLTEAKRLNLKVIVDLHPQYNTQRLALTGDPQYPALLTKLAQMLPKYGLNNVALELMNEPISPVGDSCEPSFDWNAFQQKFYSAARAGSKTLTLIATGKCWGGINGLLELKPLQLVGQLGGVQDKNVIYSLHDYDPMFFTHQSASWSGWQLAYSRGVPYPITPERMNAALPGILYNVPNKRLRAELQGQLEALGTQGFNKATLQKELARASDWGKKNNARLLLGEFGALVNVTPPQDRVQWIRDMRESAQALGMAYAMWGYDSSDGASTFGPFRSGSLEVGALEALGFKAPSEAKPTPSNLVDTRVYPINPVTSTGTVLADFEARSQSNFGVPTSSYSYGKPDNLPPVSGPVPYKAPSSTQSGRLEFPYDIPLNNDYGGVTAIIGLKSGSSVDFTPYTHLRLELAATGGTSLRVALEKDGVDNGGDNPEVNLPSSDTLETFDVPLESFKQAGWGKAVDIGPILKGVERVSITANTTGTKGVVKIDNIRLVRLDEASSAPALSTEKAQVLQNYELEGDATNLGGSSILYGYQENAAHKTTVSSSKVPNGAGKALEVQFKLSAPNGYAAVVAGAHLQPGDAPLDLTPYAALRLDLASKLIGQVAAGQAGRSSLRVMLVAGGIDTSYDFPNLILSVDPTLKTYRLPLENFAQDGWGKAVNLSEYLKQVTSVEVRTEKVGSEGTMTLDNVLLEKK